MRQVGLQSVQEYLEYFSKHQDQELTEVVSLVSTHTTQFFREPAHFDHLVDEVFPRLVARGSQPIKIWSAAASSGEEAYSLAISWFEYWRSKGVSSKKAPPCQIVGTDIDINMVHIAAKGIYSVQSVAGLSPILVERYFSRGRDSLGHLVKVRDEVHKICSFRQFNLINPQFPRDAIDIIFLRNVLIYFQQDTIQKIANNLEKSLSPEGVLYIGHSESLSSIKSNFEVYGNSIYRPKGAGKLKAKSQCLEDAVKGSAILPLKSKIRVFIIDDSSTIRSLIKSVLKQDPEFEVVGEAENPTQIVKSLDKSFVDVVTLDIHMPEQDGISYLKSVRAKDHAPIVMISSVSYQDGTDYMNCLELGAVDYIEKPNGQTLAAEGERIRLVLRAAARLAGAPFKDSSIRVKSSPTAAVIYTPTPLKKDLIVIGASTGGVEAIKILLKSFPKESPPVLIVQHIPQEFSKTLADRLNQTCSLNVKEAADHNLVLPSQTLIAPGGKQMRVHMGTRGLEIEITTDPPVNRHRPSVDYLFRSVADLGPKWNVAAALLTGMGDDGAQGLLQLRQRGMHTIAQDEESCVVYGMPKVAVELNAAVEVLPLQSIAYHLFKGLHRQLKTAS
jgi:two-component system chemotaxis response regulator CheB